MSRMFAKRSDGRPARLELHGLFVIAPQTFFKLFESSLQSRFRELGAYQLVNIMRRVDRMRTEPPGSKKEIRALGEMLTFAPCEPDVPELLAILDRIVDGDPEARAWAATPRFYEVLPLGRGVSPSEWSVRDAYLIELERVGCKASADLTGGDPASAVETIRRHPISSKFLWPGAVDALLSTTNFQSHTWQTAAMAMEAHLGWLAAWDVSVAREMGVTESIFSSLFPSGTRPGRNPTSLLFDELKRRVEAKSVAEIVAAVTSVSSETLYRWSSGMQFPERQTVMEVAATFGFQSEALELGFISDASSDLFLHQYDATKLINMIGFTCEELVSTASPFCLPTVTDPWPSYPFGYLDFESWAAARYPFWLEYMHEHGDALLELARTPQPPG